jgi:MFS family permease
MYGIFYAFGVFFTPIRTEFGWSSAETAAASSIQAVTYIFSAIFMGKLTDVYGPKLPIWAGSFLVTLGLTLSSQTVTLLQFYLFYGIVTSMGIGAMFAPTYSTVMRWFVKRRGTALGLITAGTGLGALLMPPVCERLIALYGWRQALFISGMLVLVVMLVAGFLIKNPTREELEVHGELLNDLGKLQSSQSSDVEGVTLSMALKTGPFWLLLLIYIFFSASTGIPITHMVPSAVAMGIPSLIASGFLSVFGASSVVGKLTIGFLADKIGKIRGLICCFTLLTISIIPMMAIRDIEMLYFLAAVFGYAFGGIIPQLPAVLGDFFGSTSIGVIFGVFDGLGWGIGGGIGPILGGYFKDVTGSYQLAFLFSGIIGAIAIISLIFLMCLHRDLKVQRNR